MPSLNVTLAGSSGNLGPHILTALLAANHKVTTLHRSGSSSSTSHTTTTIQHPYLTTKLVDYTSLTSLTSALQSQDVVISTLPPSQSLASHKLLIDAAAAAGVKRFFPSEFGSDVRKAANRDLPVYKGKMEVYNHLVSVAERNPGFSYTVFLNNAFLDWGLKNDFVVDLTNHKAVMVNGPRQKFSTTRLETVAKGVVGVLANLEETRNREVRVHDRAVTLGEVVEAIKEVDGKEWEVVVKGEEEVVREAYEELGKEDGADVRMAMVGFLRKAIWGKESGGDFTGVLDNELLGVQELSGEEFREVVKGIVGGK